VTNEEEEAILQLSIILSTAAEAEFYRLDALPVVQLPLLGLSQAQESFYPRDAMRKCSAVFAITWYPSCHMLVLHRNR